MPAIGTDESDIHTTLGHFAAKIGAYNLISSRDELVAQSAEFSMLRWIFDLLSFTQIPKRIGASYKINGKATADRRTSTGS